jgi:hypothetical protein
VQGKERLQGGFERQLRRAEQLQEPGHILPEAWLISHLLLT